VSDGDRSDGKKKTLLPELLPEPRPQTGQGPRERVAVRARAMLDRLSGLKTSAGAALLAVHCGYGVVDPLPPPPAQCASQAQPFANLRATGAAAAADGGGWNAVIQLTNYSAVGYQVTAVRVTMGGTFLWVEDRSRSGTGGSTDFQISIRPDGSDAPIEFEVDLGCDGAAATRHFRATYRGGGYEVVDLG